MRRVPIGFSEHGRRKPQWFEFALQLLVALLGVGFGQHLSADDGGHVFAVDHDRHHHINQAGMAEIVERLFPAGGLLHVAEIGVDAGLAPPGMRIDETANRGFSGS